MNYLPRGLGAAAIATVMACGPGGPQETATEGDTSGVTTTDPTSTDPTSTGETSTEPTTTTAPPPECRANSDCGRCGMCFEGECIGVDCPNENQCYEDYDCGDGRVCKEDFRGNFCLEIPALRACDQQVLALTLVETQGVGFDMELADLDGDGDLDVALARPGEVEVLLGDGAGGLIAGGVFPTGLDIGVLHVESGDFDGDGEPDLAVLREAPVGELVLLFGQDAVFAAPALETLGTDPRELFVGDVDGDGALDLLAHDPSVVELALRLGDGAGQFAPEVIASTQQVLVPVGGDVSGAGLLEIVGAAHNVTSPTFRLLRWDTDAFVEIETQGAVGTTPLSSLGIAALDGQGRAELLGLRLLGGAAALTIWHDQAFDERLIVGATAIAGAGDVDGSGVPDVVTFMPDAPDVAVHFTDAAGMLSCTQAYSFGGRFTPQRVAVGDLDGDGKADLVALGAGTTVAVLRSGP